MSERRVFTRTATRTSRSRAPTPALRSGGTGACTGSDGSGCSAATSLSPRRGSGNRHTTRARIEPGTPTTRKDQRQLRTAATPPATPSPIACPKNGVARCSAKARPRTSGG